MVAKSKFMVSVRLPTRLVERIDFVVRNTDSPELISRSAIVLAAVEAWLPAREKRLRELGLVFPTVPGE